jgi:hypothetical protein
MFTLRDGREYFYQWDLDRQVVIADPSIKEVHFCNRTNDCSLVVKVNDEDGLRVANVPNILLQSNFDIRVFGYDGKATLHDKKFKVNARSKPSDYIYTETEVYTVKEMLEDALQEAKDSGDFKGDKGDKGDAGSIKFTIVTELPAEGDDTAIYLLPSGETSDDNAYDEYIYTNGAWEKIGTTSVEVDLTDYVKKTDYANSANAGVVKAGGTHFGISVRPDGVIQAEYASESEIAKKEAYRKIIAPKFLDYAVKAGMTTNALEWTDEEKASARDLIGALPKMYATTNSILTINGASSEITLKGYTNEYPFKGKVYIPGGSGVGDTIVGDGYLVTNIPTRDYQCANKKYVDDAIANSQPNIDTTLFANALNSVKSGKAIGFDDLSPLMTEVNGIKLKKKNLIPPVTPQNINGIEVTLTDDGGICLNGSVTEGMNGATIQVMLNVDDIKGGNYVFTVRKNQEYPRDKYNGPAMVYLDVYGVSDFNTENKFSTPIGYKPASDMAYFYYTAFEGEVYDNFIMYPQLEEGITATEFTPYVADFTQAYITKYNNQLFDGNNLKTAAISEESLEWPPVFRINAMSNFPGIHFGGRNSTEAAGVAYIETQGIEEMTVSFVRAYDWGSDSDNYMFYLWNEFDENGYIKDATTTEVKQITSNDIVSTTLTTKGYKYIGVSAWCGPGACLCNPVFSVSKDGTYAEYVEGVKYNADENGIVNGVIPDESGFTTLVSSNGVAIEECKYNRDINKAFEELQNAIISLGGNV